MNIAGNVNNASKPYTGQGSAGMLINMYYSTPFSSPGLVDGKLVNKYLRYMRVSQESIGLSWRPRNMKTPISASKT